MFSTIFVGTALPDLKIDHPPEVGFEEYNRLLQDNLDESEYAPFKTLRLFYDLENIRLFWKNRNLNIRGNFSLKDLEEESLNQAIFPLWMIEYLEKYATIEDRLLHFSEMSSNFFKLEAESATGFLKKYFNFERELRLLLAAMRAKMLNRDLSKELEGEDLDDPFILDILAQKEGKSYTLPPEYQDLSNYLKKDPLDLAQNIDEYRFNKIEELIGLEVFSSDRLLAYMAQLFIVEKRTHSKTGDEILNQIINLRNNT